MVQDETKVRLRSPHRFPYIAHIADAVAAAWATCHGDVDAVADRVLREHGAELAHTAWEIRRRGDRVRIAWWLDLAREFDTFGPEHQATERLLEVYGALARRGVSPFARLAIKPIPRPVPYRTPACYEVPTETPTRGRSLGARLSALRDKDRDRWFRALVQTYRRLRSDDSLTLLAWQRWWRWRLFHLSAPLIPPDDARGLHLEVLPEAWRPILQQPPAPDEGLLPRIRYCALRTAYDLLRVISAPLPPEDLEHRAWSRLGDLWELIRDALSDEQPNALIHVLADTGADILLSWWVERARWLGTYGPDHSAVESFLSRPPQGAALTAESSPPYGLQPMPLPDSPPAAMRLHAARRLGWPDYRRAVLAQLQRRGKNPLNDAEKAGFDLRSREWHRLLRNGREYMLVMWWADVHDRRLKSTPVHGEAWLFEFLELAWEGIEPFSSDPDLAPEPPYTLDFAKLPAEGHVLVPYLWRYGKRTRHWNESRIDFAGRLYEMPPPQVLADLKQVVTLLDGPAGRASMLLDELYHSHPEADYMCLLERACDQLLSDG